MNKCGYRLDEPKKTEYEILTTAIRVFGEEAQEGVAIEECSELIQAISHKHRGREHNIAEEIADVEIMLEQLKIINNCRNEVAEIHKQKIDRLFQKVFDMCL
jgi:NTP pyrophosphatase (non-canonical NTP hydrolase)